MIDIFFLTVAIIGMVFMPAGLMLSGECFFHTFVEKGLIKRLGYFISGALMLFLSVSNGLSGFHTIKQHWGQSL